MVAISDLFASAEKNWGGEFDTEAAQEVPSENRISYSELCDPRPEMKPVSCEFIAECHEMNADDRQSQPFNR